MVFTSVNHPSSNGIVEWVNQKFVQQLQFKQMVEKKVTWTAHLHESIEEYNDSVHSSTGYSQHYLLTGADLDNLNENESLDDNYRTAIQNSNKKHEENAQWLIAHRRNLTYRRRVRFMCRPNTSQTERLSNLFLRDPTQ